MWIPDGRARAIRSDCEASIAALDGLPIDMYLVHAPDPRTPWRTSMRALARLVDEGLVNHVGVSNVSLRQLEEALELAPVAAIEVALSPFDDGPERSGLIDACTKAGITVIAHSPLGGTRACAGVGTQCRPRRGGRRPRSHGCGDRARVAPRHLASRDRHPRCTAPAHRALVSARPRPS